MAKLEKTIDDLEGRIQTLFLDGALGNTGVYRKSCSGLISLILACITFPLAASLTLLMFPPVLHSSSFSLHSLSSLLTDELYAQKLKYKAISEELDHALNDMTSM